MEPPADLISNLIWLHHLTWRGSNKTLSLSLKRRHPSSVLDAS